MTNIFYWIKVEISVTKNWYRIKTKLSISWIVKQRALPCSLAKICYDGSYTVIVRRFISLPRISGGGTDEGVGMRGCERGEWSRKKRSDKVARRRRCTVSHRTLLLLWPASKTHTENNSTGLKYFSKYKLEGHVFNLQI